MSKVIDRARLAALRKIEEERFLANHKKSGEAFTDSQKVKIVKTAEFIKWFSSNLIRNFQNNPPCSFTPIENIDK